MPVKRKKGKQHSSGKQGKQGTTTSSGGGSVRAGNTFSGRGSLLLPLTKGGNSNNNNHNNASTTEGGNNNIVPDGGSSSRLDAENAINYKSGKNSNNKRYVSNNKSKDKNSNALTASTGATADAVSGSTTTDSNSNNSKISATLGFVTINSRSSSIHHPNNPYHDLILTSTSRRRGEYECDYCHNDISQLPRIRCAICPDFDLCFDCFITTDHVLTLKRLKAASATQLALLQETGGTNAVATAATSLFHHTIQNHEVSHGYKVCDSTRYPLFPTNKQVSDYVTAQQAKHQQQQSEPSPQQQQQSEQLPQPTEQSSEQPQSQQPTTLAAASSKAGPMNATTTITNNNISSFMLQSDYDMKNYWTIEEDLRLLDGIKTHGLGNWVDIAECVAGYGSYGKTPRRCMERYLDDYLGKYGCILPSYTLIPSNYLNSITDTNNKNNSSNDSSTDITNAGGASTASTTTEKDVTSGSNMVGSTIDDSGNNINSSTVNDTEVPSSSSPDDADTKADTTGSNENTDTTTENTSTDKDDTVNLSSPKPSETNPTANSSNPTRTSKRKSSNISRSPSATNFTSFRQIVGSSMSVGDFLSSASNHRKKYKAISTDILLQPNDSTAMPYWIPAPTCSNYISPSSSSTTTTDTPKQRKDTNANDDDVLMGSPTTAAEATTAKSTVATTNGQISWEKLWPIAYIPTVMGKEGAILYGQEVGRDQSYKAEQIYVKTIASCETKEQVEKIRQEWMENKLLKPGGPTVLPMRIEDIHTLPGSDLSGYMPRRGDFDVEYDNEAEQAVADMEFLPGESDADKQLKLKVLEIYNRKLDEREKRKAFVISRQLYDYRKHQQYYNDPKNNITQDERDLILRMRLFERYHTPSEHKQFLYDIIKAKRLRKEIMKLQLYKSLGIKTLLEAERYELDKQRRQYHKNAVLSASSSRNNVANSSLTMNPHDGLPQQQRSVSAKIGNSGSSQIDRLLNETLDDDTNETSSSISYWKQYRDRKERKSINRGNLSLLSSSSEIKDSSSIQEVAAHQNNKDGIHSKNNAIENDSNVTTSSSQEKDDVVVVDDGKRKQAASFTNDATDIDREVASTSEKGYEEKKIIPIKRKSDEKQLQQPISSSTEPMAASISREAIIETLPGYHLLSRKEAQLCLSISITPEQYLEIKKTLICECITHGFMNNNNTTSSISSPNRRNSNVSNSSSNNNNNLNTSNHSVSGQSSVNAMPLFKLDIERRGSVIDFIVSAGWISSQFGNVAKSQT